MITKLHRTYKLYRALPTLVNLPLLDRRVDLIYRNKTWPTHVYFEEETEKDKEKIPDG